MMTNHCAICGSPISGRKWRYCSEACAAEARRRRDREGKGGEKAKPFRTVACRDCGKIFHGSIKSFRCADCQRIADQRSNAESYARKRAGKTRPLGSIDLCTVCGVPYTVNSGKQKYCPDCKDQATRAAISAHKRQYLQAARQNPERREAINSRKRRNPAIRICRQCGRSFESLGGGAYCSEACRTAARKAYHAEYDKTRRKRKEENT